MIAFPRRIRHSLLLRSLIVQASWNYQTLLGTGFAFMLLPALRYSYRDDPEGLRSAVVRHTELFNSHPYLVTVAAGAIARLESERVDPLLLARFKTALRGSLGALGDQLIWQGWRPAVALFAVALLLVGAPWWAAVAAFLLLYNALHLWLRLWGLNAGLANGLNVGPSLRQAALQSLATRVGNVGALIAGFCTAVAFAGAAADLPSAGLAALAVAAGVALGLQTHRVFGLALLLFWAGGLVSSALG